MASALDGGGWLTSCPGRLYPRERPDTHCTGGWVGPRAGLDRCGKSRPPPGFDPRTFQPVASRYTHYAMPTHTVCVDVFIICRRRTNFTPAVRMIRLYSPGCLPVVTLHFTSPRWVLPVVLISFLTFRAHRFDIKVYTKFGLLLWHCVYTVLRLLFVSKSETKPATWNWKYGCCDKTVMWFIGRLICTSSCKRGVRLSSLLLKHQVALMVSE